MATNPMSSHDHEIAVTIGAGTSEPVEIFLSKPVQTQALLANPAPLGQLGFALTAFVFASHDAGFLIPQRAPHSIVIGLAVAYGGLAQFLAGVFEFQAGNTFGYTTFCSYGAFWLSLGVNEILGFGVNKAFKDRSQPGAFNEAMGLYFLGWTVFTVMMLLCTLRTNVCTVTFFSFVTLMFTLLTTAALTQDKNIVKADGICGMITAAISAYLALAQLANKQNSFFELPIGLFTPKKQE